MFRFRVSIAVGLAALALPLAAQDPHATIRWPGAGSIRANNLVNMGDVDRDGVDDIVFAADSSELWVLSGRTFRRIRRMHHWSTWPNSYANVGDVDGDGYEDLAVSARTRDPWNLGRGSTLIYSGYTGMIIREQFGRTRQEIGSSLFAELDFNRDGTRDIVIMTDRLGGSIRAYSGKDLSILFEAAEPSRYSEFGFFIVPAGDRNADGVPDLAVAAPGASLVQIVSGRDGGVLQVLRGPALSRFGTELFNMGDQDADTVDDFLIGSSNGRALISGKSGAQIRALPSDKHASIVFDHDRDGLPDLMFASSFGGGVRIVSSKSGATLWTQKFPGTGLGRQRVGSVADLDGDGRSEFYEFASEQTSGSTIVLRIWSSADRSLSSSSNVVASSVPGTVEYRLRAGKQNAGQFFFLLGSLSGTRPGIRLRGVTLPLNPDPWFQVTLAAPNQAPHSNTFGFLNLDGEASSRLMLPPNLPALSLDYAFVVLRRDLQIPFASQAVRLEVVR